MKKLFTLSVIMVFLTLVVACGGGKYADARKAMEKYVGVTENFVASLEKATDAKSTAASLTAYADGMKGIAADMKAVQKKYPELKNQQNVPEEMKPIMKKVEEVMPRMMSAMMKLSQYASDPLVLEAQKKFQEAMSGLE